MKQCVFLCFAHFSSQALDSANTLFMPAVSVAIWLWRMLYFHSYSGGPSGMLNLNQGRSGANFHSISILLGKELPFRWPQFTVVFGERIRKILCIFGEGKKYQGQRSTILVEQFGFLECDLWARVEYQLSFEILQCIWGQRIGVNDYLQRKENFSIIFFKRRIIP